MKKYLFLLCALGCFSAQAATEFCCAAGNEAACCAERGKKFCSDDNSCRTKCLNEICPAGYRYNTTLLKCEPNS